MIRRIGLVLLMALAVAGSAVSQNALVLRKDWSEKYLEYLSGDLAMDHVAVLAGWHRIPPSPQYDLAAAYVAQRAREYGLADVRVLSFPGDGQTEYWTWRSFPEWEGTQGKLSWVTGGKGVIANFTETPVSLAVYSQNADVDADVVDVGPGYRDVDYSGKDVRGKIVFTTGFPSMVYKQAIVTRGAIGIICWFNEATQPDAAAWFSLPAWNVDGKLNPGPKAFAFVLSMFQGRPLKQALDAGKEVRVHATVAARTWSGEYRLVTATVPGTDPKAGEIWFSAHLDHQKPGANDNASGSAAILEIARSLAAAIGEGALPKPQATLRFLWGPEMIGNLWYVFQRSDAAVRVLGEFNLDTVGENQAKLNSSLWVVRPPETRASYFADLAENAARFTIRNNRRLLGGRPDGPFLTSPGGSRNIFNGDVVPYVGASDHLVFNDGTIGIPAVAYIHYPDYTWHTNTDKIENVDPTTLKRVSFMAAAAAIAAGWKEAADFSSVLANSQFYGDLRLAHDRFVAGELLRTASADNSERAGLVLRYGYLREHKALESLKNSVQFSAADLPLIAAAESRLDQLLIQDREGAFQSASWMCTTPDHLRISMLKPSRTGWKGPLDQYRNVLEDKLGPDTVRDSPAAAYFGSVAFYEALNLADGTRSVRDIYHAVAAECLSDNYPLPSPAAFVDYFELLAKAGLISMK